jgi:two-component system chemotaxis response regulator CheB
MVKRLVAIGASSGGIEALRSLVRGLPSEFPAAICIVVHVAPDSPGVLKATIEKESPLPVFTAADGLRLDPAAIYVAPPDQHLLIEPGLLRVVKGPRENGFRPAIDPLFRSAAQVYGPAAVGVVLTGDLDDGSAGLWTIARLGGVTIVQDPADALFPSMPRNAAALIAPDHLVPLSAIALLLARVVQTPPGVARATPPPSLEVEVDIAKGRNAGEAGLEAMGDPSPFACPDCHGVLLRLKERQPLRFRCHVGHAYSPHSLVSAITRGVDDALWTGVRALEEAALLLDQIAVDDPAGDESGPASSARADGYRRLSETLRRELLGGHSS